MSNTTTMTAPVQQQLNPFTPMAFLPPDVAFQINISTYMLAGSCGIIFWDVVNNLNADYTLLFRHRIKLPTAVYMTSRLATLGFVIGATIYQIAPVGACAHFQMVITIFNAIAVPTTSILFFLRVRAIYEGNKWVVSFFVLMWLAVLVGCFLTTQGVTGTTIGPTSYCMVSPMSSYVAACAIIPLVNDTLIFLAISWRLARNSLHHVNLKSGFRAMIFGDYMPVFSRALLQDGQKYYLSTVCGGILVVIMLCVNAFPVAYKVVFMVPNSMFMNIMACQVFRRTKLDPFPDNGISNIDFQTLPLSFAAGAQPTTVTAVTRR